MRVWTEIARKGSEREYEYYQWDAMCCSVSYQTERACVCSVCAGDHEGVVHRIRCTSKTCSPNKNCAVRWKVFHCMSRDEWLIQVNHEPHGRATHACGEAHAGRVTKEIKDFVAEQAKGRVTPLILSARLSKSTTILIPKHGIPDTDKLGGALKRHRNDHGMRNTIEGIAAFVAPWVYTPRSENEKAKAVIFGISHDREGMPAIGGGTDTSPFHLGVTLPQLIDDSLRFVSENSLPCFTPT